MRTAIVHYWLNRMRGETVVEALCRMLPHADIFTLFYEPNRISPLIRSRVVKTSFLNPLALTTGVIFFMLWLPL